MKKIALLAVILLAIHITKTLVIPKLETMAWSKLESGVGMAYSGRFLSDEIGCKLRVCTLMEECSSDNYGTCKQTIFRVGSGHLEFLEQRLIPSPYFAVMRRAETIWPVLRPGIESVVYEAAPDIHSQAVYEVRFIEPQSTQWIEITHDAEGRIQNAPLWVRWLIYKKLP